MTDLEYKIGQLEVNPKRIVQFEGTYSTNINHRFIVTISNNLALIYVAEEQSHYNIHQKYCKDEEVVGGGFCIINENKKFVILEKSTDYKGIPKPIALEFAKLIVPELQDRNIEVEGILINLIGTEVNAYWIKRGYQKYYHSKDDGYESLP